jgi:hypothetical protein
MKKMILALTICAFTAMPVLLPLADADESVKSDVKESVKDVKRGARRTTRAVKDKTCELVNGKMECAGKKLKHKVQNVGDDVKDAVN